MAPSMKIASTIFGSFILALAWHGASVAQTDAPRDLWSEFKDRPNRQPTEQVEKEPAVKNRPRSEDDRNSSGPKRFPPVEKVNVPNGDRDQWWETEANAEADYARPNQPVSKDGRGDLIQSSQIIAVVGNEPILAGDLLGRINEALQPYVGQVPEEELDARRWQLVEQLLPASIESKMVYLDFVRNMKPEQISALRANIYSQFDEKQLPDLVEKANVRNITELESKMRAVGASLQKTRRLFFEQVAAREVIRRGGDVDREISPAELLAFYRERLDEYEVQAQAKWEQLTIKVPSYANSEQLNNAKLRLGKLGNIVLNGTPFSVVAKQGSEGPTAHEGGAHDWTVKGSLVSTKLEEQIFWLPLNTMSDIIRDDTGVHIIRVSERKEAGHVPFTEAQKEIRDKILEEARNEKIAKYLTELKDRTYVWNYFESKTAELEKNQRRF